MKIIQNAVIGIFGSQNADFSIDKPKARQLQHSQPTMALCVPWSFHGERGREESRWDELLLLLLLLLCCCWESRCCWCCYRLPFCATPGQMVMIVARVKEPTIRIPSWIDVRRY